MSRLQILRARARTRGCHVLHSMDDLTAYDVYVESESILGPRDLSLTYRQAVHLAYQISIAKHQKLTVTCT